MLRNSAAFVFVLLLLTACATIEAVPADPSAGESGEVKVTAFGASEATVTVNPDGTVEGTAKSEGISDGLVGTLKALFDRVGSLLGGSAPGDTVVNVEVPTLPAPSESDSEPEDTGG